MTIEDDYLLNKVDDLEKKLDQEIENNKQRNKEMQVHLQNLSRDLDVLFASKTWTVGYGITNLYRKLMGLIGRKENGQYMNADHFKNLIESCEFYAHRKTKITPTLTQTMEGLFPKNHYEPSHVEVALKDLWKAQKQEKDELQ
jgi:hypothetical protein